MQLVKEIIGECNRIHPHPHVHVHVHVLNVVFGEEDEANPSADLMDNTFAAGVWSVVFYASKVFLPFSHLCLRFRAAYT
jgi:hypothetical protein